MFYCKVLSEPLMFINIRRRGYWASYNRAFYKDAFEASGAANMTDRYGDYFSYKNTVRAKVAQCFFYHNLLYLD